MANHNYQPGYPLNLETNSSDNELTLFQKTKAEFERLYRLLNDGLSYIDQVLETIQSSVSGFDDRVNAAVNQIRQLVNDLESRVNTMVASALANYYTKAQVDDKFTNYYTKAQTDALLSTINSQLNGLAIFRGGVTSFTAPYNGILIAHSNAIQNDNTSTPASTLIMPLNQGASKSFSTASEVVFIKTN